MAAAEGRGGPERARILETRRIGSRVRCFTREQILASLGTASPHYGDGAYATAHDALREAPAEVQRAHGLSLATMAYRAVLLVHDRVRLRKFHQTAGVTRSRPRGTLRVDDLEFFDSADVEMLYVQRWDGASWENSVEVALPAQPAPFRNPALVDRMRRSLMGVPCP